MNVKLEWWHRFVSVISVRNRYRSFEEHQHDEGKDRIVPVLVQAPQPNAHHLKHKHGRNRVLGHQVPKERHGNFHGVAAPPRRRGFHLVRRPVPAAVQVSRKRAVGGVRDPLPANPCAFFGIASSSASLRSEEGGVLESEGGRVGRQPQDNKEPQRLRSLRVHSLH